ncbi:heavy-metal-associated domain-containing protein [Planosporangium thailandense]|uniref:heavy-metal-associated domain-containing protein n=1 Tax=Planosporangium thailandense TaxID=765197 RepID=UPI0030B8567C
MTAADSYDRTAAARVLAGLAHAGLFASDLTGSDAAPVGDRTRIAYTATPMTAEPGSHLTYSQRRYLERFMRPCPPRMLTSATHRVVWTDSAGVPNTGHFGPGALGPVVPIAVRETTLALWRDLAANAVLADAVARLDPGDRAVLAATTTDQEPLEIFRIGVEAAGRALAQHALLAHQTPYATPAAFARGMRDCGIFSLVATRWFWELQASTYRRGMIHVAFATLPNGTVRYAAESLDTLRAMKDATIAEARAVMRKATGAEGLTVEQAVARYHDELDLISKQYALMDEDTQPRCLAQMTNVVGGERFSVLPVVVRKYVETFVRVLEVVELTERTADPVEDATPTDALTDADDGRFHVPDMNCRHCQTTIRGLLESMGVDVVEVNLTTKRVVAEFRSARNRQRAFEAIRDSGYTVVSGPTV